MSINGHLLALSPALAEALARDPGRVASLTMAAGLGGGLPGGAGGLVQGVDGLLRQVPAVGCLWGLLPRFLRQGLLRRLLPVPSAAPPVAPDPGPSAPPKLRLVTDAEPEEEGDEEEPEEEALPAGAGPSLGLHKDWQLLHWGITGQVDEAPGPLGQAVLGGEELGEDLGYGPARLLAPSEVKAVASALGRLALDDLRRQLAQPPPEEVYSADFLVEEGEEAVEEVVELFGELVAFYREAAAQGQAVLLWLD